MFKLICPSFTFVFICLSLSSCINGSGGDGSKTNGYTIYAGSSGGIESTDGVYSFQLNSEGNESNLSRVVALKNASFLTTKANVLYSVSEVEAGTVSAYQIDSKDSLQITPFMPDNIRTSDGKTPVYLSIDQSNRIFVANYGEYLGRTSSVGYFDITADGTITNLKQLIQYSGVVSHAHSINPYYYYDQELVVVADLGTNLINLYTFDANQQLSLESSVFTGVDSGPRSVSYLQKDENAFLYVADELDSRINVLQYNPQNKNLIALQSLKSYQGTLTAARNYPGEIQIDKSKQYVYVSNRGMENIALFKIQENGELSYVNEFALNGSWPRHFSISADNKFLITANQNSNNLSLFSINQSNGYLIFIRNINVPHPNAVIFK